MKALVLGGGISGLSAAWFLTKAGVDVQLWEKEARLGGWLEYARTFLFARSPSLLRLIQEMGLEIVRSDPKSAQRLLWHRGKLRSLFSLIPWGAVLREPFLFRQHPSDESIYEFAVRKFGAYAAETLFDPLTLGIYAGDIRKLSVRSCFPQFTSGSVVLQALFSQKSEGLFTVRGGAGALVDALAQKLRIHLSTPAHTLFPSGFDAVFSALPVSEVARFTGHFPQVRSASLWVVHLTYAGNVFPRPAYGYLVPTQEREQVLGAVWDSSIFPGGEGSRLTVLLREGVADPVGAASEAMRKHLGIVQPPLSSLASLSKEAIPQMEVGYEVQKQAEEAALRERFPGLFLLGNFLGSPSVEACIQRAEAQVYIFLNKYLYNSKIKIN